MKKISILLLIPFVAFGSETEISQEENKKANYEKYSRELDDLQAQHKVEQARLALLTTKKEIGEMQPTSEPKKAVKKSNSTAYVFKPNIKVYAIFDETAIVSIDSNKQTLKKGEVFKGYEVLSIHGDGVLLKRLKTSKQYSINF